MYFCLKKIPLYTISITWIIYYLFTRNTEQPMWVPPIFVLAYSVFFFFLNYTQPIHNVHVSHIPIRVMLCVMSLYLYYQLPFVNVLLHSKVSVRKQMSTHLLYLSPQCLRICLMCACCHVETFQRHWRDIRQNCLSVCSSSLKHSVRITKLNYKKPKIE